MFSLKSPIACVWEITNACNFKCPHCRAYMDNMDDSSQEIENHIIDELIKNEVFSVNLSGGEPLLNKRIDDIIYNLSSNNIDVGVSTNGYLFTNRCNDLIESGLKFVQISLDGPKNIHNKFRGINDAYEKAISAMNQAKKAGLFVQMNTTITSKNINYAIDNIELANKLGIDRIFFRRVVSAGLAQNNSDVLLDKKEYLSLLNNLINIKNSNKYFVNISIDDPILATISDRYNDLSLCCSAGITSLGINSVGDVYPCIFLRNKIGNLNEESMETIWNNSETLKRLRNRDINGCGECPHKFSCGGCRASNGIFEKDNMCPIQQWG